MESTMISQIEEMAVQELDRIEEMAVQELDRVEEILGYKFKNPNLASEALSHDSVMPDNTRLKEFGNAVLNLSVAFGAFNSYPKLPSGSLTNLRSANVNTERLARIAVKHRLHNHLRHRDLMLDVEIAEFIESTLKYPFPSYGFLNPPKALAELVESLVGAVFLDTNSSLVTAWKVFRRLAEPFINKETMVKQPVSELHELCQERRLKLKFEKIALEEKIVVVLIDEKEYGRASYVENKKIARNLAAKIALERMEMELNQQSKIRHPFP